MELLSSRQAAEYLGVSPRTIERWRLQGEGPSYIRLGRTKCVRYSKEDLQSFVGEHSFRHTSEEGVDNE